MFNFPESLFQKVSELYKDSAFQNNKSLLKEEITNIFRVTWTSINHWILEETLLACRLDSICSDVVV